MEQPISVSDAGAEIAAPRPRRSIFEWLSRTFFSISLFLLPFFVFPIAVPVEVGKKGLFAVGVLSAFALWLISRLEKGEIHLPKGAINWALLLLVLTSTLSSLFGGSLGHSFFGVGYETTTTLSLLVWAFGSVLASLYFRGEGSLSRLVRALFFGYGAAILVFVINLIWPGFLFGALSRATDTLVGKWNDFGLYSGLMLIFALVSFEVPGLVKKNRARFVGVLALIGLLFVNLEFAWYLVAFFTLALFVYRISGKFAFSESDLSRRSLLSPVAFVFILSVLFILLGGTREDGTQQVLGAAVTNLENKLGIVSIEARPSWPATIQVSQAVAAKHLFLGDGPNNFDREWRLSKPDVINQSLFWNTDFGSGYGFILSSFVTGGLLGAVAWFLLLVSFLVVSLRALYRIGRSSEKFEHLLVLFIAGFYLWLVALLYVPDNVLLALAFVVTGMLVGLLSEVGIVRSAHLSFGGSSRARFVGVFATVLAVILSLVGSYVTAKRIYAATLFEEGAAKLVRGGDADRAFPLVEKASNLVREDRYFRSLAQLSVIQFGRVATRTDLPKEQAQAQFTELFRKAYTYADTATKIGPDNSDNWISLGGVYEAVVPIKIPGAYEAAAKAYQMAVAKNPKSPLPYLSLARLEFTKGDEQKSRQYVASGLALKPNYAELIFLSSEIEAKLGNLANAIRSAEQAAVLAPNDIGVWFQIGVLRYDNKEYAAAAKALEQAISLNSSYSNARYFLGLSYDKLGARDKALEQFKQIYTLNPDSAEVKQIIANLEAGRAALVGAAPQPEPTIPKKKK